MIDSLLKILKEYLLSSHYLDLKPFTDYLLPPEIISFKANKDVVLEGVEVEFSWIVENALSVSIEPEIGIVSANGKHYFKPKNQGYKIIAQGHFENAEKTLELKLFPTPLIETLFVPAPKINEKINLQIQFPKFPNIDISIKNIKNGIYLNDNKFHSSIPTFNFKSFYNLELMNHETKTTWKNIIIPFISRLSNINNWIFKK